MWLSCVFCVNGFFIFGLGVGICGGGISFFIGNYLIFVGFVCCG